MSYFTNGLSTSGLWGGHVPPADRRTSSSHHTMKDRTNQHAGDGSTYHRQRYNGGQEESERKPAVSSSSLLLVPPAASSMNWNAADIIALYMRRQRCAIQRGQAGETESAAAADGGSNRLLASYPPKLLLLGDDAVVQELTAMLRAVDEAEAKETAGSKKAGHPHDASPSHAPAPEVYTVPDAVDGLTALRAELCRWCDVVLLCYHVANPASFVYLQESVVPFFFDACANTEEEEKDDDETKEESGKDDPGRGSAHASRLCRASERCPFGVWPSASPPLIIVGLGAEARLSRPTDLQAPWITNADVLAVAAEAGVQRVVELYSHSPRHLHILLQHCRTLREVTYENLPSPAAQGRRAALKEFGLHALLRAPPPLLELHPGPRCVHVVLPPRVPSVSMSEGEQTSVLRCLYWVSDAADTQLTSSSAAAPTPTLEVPPSGVLTYDDVYAAYTQATGRPAQHAAAIVLIACTVVAYLFPSESVQQRLPVPAAAPSGYVDVFQRCCRVTLPTQSVRGGGASRVQCTLDGKTAYLDVPMTSSLVRGSRMSAAASTVCVPLDDDRPHLSYTASGGGEEQRVASAWLPWPTTRAAHTSSRELQVVVEMGESSAATTFAIPPVLPAPVVDYHAQQRCLRLHVPGYRADQVEIRYTLDGSVPSSVHGLVYRDDILLNENDAAKGQQQSSSPVVHVRAAAYPKLAFASRMTEAHIEVGECAVHPLATPSQSSRPQLQEDEQLLSKQHMKWSSPRRSTRKVSLSTSQRPRTHLQQQQQQQQQRAFSLHSSYVDPHSSGHSKVSPRPSSQLHRSARRGSEGSSLNGSDGVTVASDTVTTRSAQLRQAFNAGLYTPPRHPFSQGGGLTPSPRRGGQIGRR